MAHSHVLNHKKQEEKQQNEKRKKETLVLKSLLHKKTNTAGNVEKHRRITASLHWDNINNIYVSYVLVVKLGDWCQYSRRKDYA